MTDVQAEPAEPSLRWWVLVFVVAMQAVTIGIASYSFAFFVLPWTREFGVLRGNIVLAITGFTVALGLISPLCGYAIDRYPRKWLLLGSAAAYAAGMLAIAIAANHYIIILIFTLILPFGAVLAGPLMAFSLIATYFPTNRGLAFGIASLGTNVGGVVMPLLVTRLLGDVTWRFVFAVLAVIVVFVVILPGTLLPLGRPAGAPPVPVSDSAKRRIVIPWAAFQIGIAYLATSLIVLAILANVGGIAADLAIAPTKAAWVTVSVALGMAGGRLSFGFLSDRVHFKILYSIIAAAIAVGVVVISHAITLSPLIAGAFLVAFAHGGVTPLITTIVMIRWGLGSFGRVMGIVYALAAMSGLGSLFVGFVRDHNGTYSLALLWLLVGMVPALICVLTLSRSAPPEERIAGTS